MSAQFGKCNFDGKTVDPKDLEQVRPVLAPYGPDSEGYLCKDNFGLIYRAFHTTEESRHELQPQVLPSGVVITWDGRLDNREDLIRRLDGDISTESTDLVMVAAAFEHWGTDAFARLMGDWALSVWDPRSQSLILAKDFVGTRHLYYSLETGAVTWCTVLDPLVLFAERKFALEEDYIAGWLSSFPAAHLTPYNGIRSVPPSSFVCLTRTKQRTVKYWDFDPGKRIRYRTDGEYEEHFRSVFSEAVRRRLRSDSPVLSELSGGMDSSSIVCMADALIRRGKAHTPRLDTVSYYDDFEPNWNERPYFTKVEEKLGRTGCHIKVSSQDSFKVELDDHQFAATPSSLKRCDEPTREFASCLISNRNRVVLSGTGGDEVTGGVPTPTPELQDLIARVRVGALIHKLKLWALDKRKPWFLVLSEAAREFLPSALAGTPKYRRQVPWLDPKFIKRNSAALQGCESRVRIFGPLPTFQGNVGTLEILRKQLGCFAAAREPQYEKRYPYLDRDLLEFMFLIPREQLVRPGERRSLMRRALVGTVPDELLHRRRKAFVARGPMASISTQWPNLLKFSQSMLASSFGIVDPEAFIDALQSVRHGREAPIVYLMRTIGLELWLQNLGDSRFLGNFHPRWQTNTLPGIPQSRRVKVVPSSAT